MKSNKKTKIDVASPKHMLLLWLAMSIATVSASTAITHLTDQDWGNFTITATSFPIGLAIGVFIGHKTISPKKT